MPQNLDVEEMAGLISAAGLGAGSAQEAAGHLQRSIEDRLLPPDRSDDIALVVLHAT